MFHTPIQKKTVKDHFHYSWWKYVLLITLCVLFWYLFFTMTAPRTPENEKIELYIYGYGESDSLNRFLENVREKDMPDMKEITAVYTVPDDTNGLMVLFTHVAAGEGDLFILPRDNFQSYAGDGLFVELDEIPEIMERCEQAGINLERGWRKNKETGERHLYGIPMTEFNGFSSYLYGSENFFLSLRVMNGNEEGTETFLKILLDQFLPGMQENGITESPAAEPEETVQSEASENL